MNAALSNATEASSVNNRTRSARRRKDRDTNSILRLSTVSIADDDQDTTMNETNHGAGKRTSLLVRKRKEERNSVAGSSTNTSKGKSRDRPPSILAKRPPRHSVIVISSDDEETHHKRHSRGPPPEPERSRKELIHLKKDQALPSPRDKAFKGKSDDSELQKELANVKKQNAQQAREIERLRKEMAHNQELVASIKVTLQCQICMELLQKPFALSPCGHVACLQCLQSWFRTPHADEDPNNPDDHIFRQKSCPACRATIYSRPVQLFLIKSIVSTLAGPVPSPRQPDQADPWEGIFPDDDAGPFEGDEDDFFDEEEEEDDDMFDVNIDEDEAEDDEGDWTYQTWAPPSVYVPEATVAHEHRDQRHEILQLLRRGATIEMIDRYHLVYTHEDGILCDLGMNNYLYLGWNITLDEDDWDGSRYLEAVEIDMLHYPHHFERAPNEDGVGWTAWKLVLAEDAVDFENTDSEAWLDEY